VRAGTRRPHTRYGRLPEAALARLTAPEGLRVIYYVLAADEQIWLFTLYDKDEVEDLTPKQCRQLKHAIHEERSARRGNA
jgi:hypothetical protein